MAKTFYITTAIDYVNSKPHAGHLYEKIIADALARWHRQIGEDVFFLTGTDEHGTKIARTAEANGKEPQEFVNEMKENFVQLCKKINAGNNDFIRTTEERHKKVAQQIWQKLLDKGFIYKGKYSGLYCVGCEAFYTEKDLVDGKCPIHQKEPEKVSEESYFFKLSKFQDKIIELYKKNPQFVLPAFRQKELLNRINEGLKDISISRKTLKWGVTAPNDPDHVIYVWVEALINYISALGYPDGEKFKKFWPANAHIIGHDISWFHTVIWPALLMAAKIPLPKTVHLHGWVLLGKEKMSKSLGVVLDPIKLIDDYGTDPVRYFFLREIPAGLDGNFTYQALVERINADLADSLGNLVRRTCVLVQNKFKGEIPKPDKFSDKEKKLIEKADKVFEKADKLMQKFEWNRAVEVIWEFIHDCNKYITELEPWKEKDEKRLATILYTLVESLRIISILTWPFIPESAEKISKQIGQKLGKFKDAKFKETTKGEIPKGEILFKKFELKQEEIDQFRKLVLKVGEIEEVKQHPDAEKLLVLKVKIGKEKRQLVAGLKEYYKPEELKGKHIIVVTNLKPAKLRGIESKGMLLAAEKDGKVRVLEAPKTEAGSDVYIEGLPSIEGKISIEEFGKVRLTTKNNKVLYGEKILKTEKEEVFVDIKDNAEIR